MDSRARNGKERPGWASIDHKPRGGKFGGNCWISGSAVRINCTSQDIVRSPSAHHLPIPEHPKVSASPLIAGFSLGTSAHLLVAIEAGEARWHERNPAAVMSCLPVSGAGSIDAAPPLRKNLERAAARGTGLPAGQPPGHKLRRVAKGCPPQPPATLRTCARRASRGILCSNGAAGDAEFALRRRWPTRELARA
jgi:hypothetical protein